MITTLDDYEVGGELVSEAERKIEAWKAARRGRFTGSKIGLLMGTGLDPDNPWSQTAISYMERVAAERLGSHENDWSSAPTSWGIDNEAALVKRYSEYMAVDVDYDPHRFIEFEDYAGSSPDGLVGTDGGIEGKCLWTPGLHFRVLRDRVVLPKYVHQVDSHLLFSKRDWFDFVSFDPRLEPPYDIAVVRVERNETRLAHLKQRLADANGVVRAWLERIEANE